MPYGRAELEAVVNGIAEAVVLYESRHEEGADTGEREHL